MKTIEYKSDRMIEKSCYSYEEDLEPEDPTNNLLYIEKSDEVVSADMYVETYTEKDAYDRFRKLIAKAVQDGLYGEYDPLKDILFAEGDGMTQYFPYAYDTLRDGATIKDNGYQCWIETINPGLIYIRMDVYPDVRLERKTMESVKKAAMGLYPDKTRAEAEQKIKEPNKSKSFYFTFGSWHKYPFGRGDFVRVDNAKDMSEAISAYKSVFPNLPNSNRINCAFYYTEEDWKSVYEEHYKGKEPARVIDALKLQKAEKKGFSR